MSDVQFEEENSYGSNFPTGINEKPKGLIGLVLKIGIAKDEKQAEIVLLIVLIVVVIITIFIFNFSSGSSSGASHPIDNAAMQRMRQNEN